MATPAQPVGMPINIGIPEDQRQDIADGVESIADIVIREECIRIEFDTEEIADCVLVFRLIQSPKGHITWTGRRLHGFHPGDERLIVVISWSLPDLGRRHRAASKMQFDQGPCGGGDLGWILECSLEIQIGLGSWRLMTIEAVACKKFPRGRFRCHSHQTDQNQDAQGHQESQYHEANANWGRISTDGPSSRNVEPNGDSKWIATCLLIYY